MSALRQPGPRPVRGNPQPATPNTTPLSKKNLSLLGQDSMLSRFTGEETSRLTLLSVGDYQSLKSQSLKSQSLRLIAGDFDSECESFRGCDCCEPRSVRDMQRDIEDILAQERNDR